MAELHITDLIELTLKSVERHGDESCDDGEEILFVTECGHAFRMYHMQDCCESVSIHDITGDLQSLIGFPITAAGECVSKDWPVDVDPNGKSDDSFTWTIYGLTTANGANVVIRWLGQSNGYYSESVYFGRTMAPIEPKGIS